MTRVAKRSAALETRQPGVLEVVAAALPGAVLQSAQLPCITAAIPVRSLTMSATARLILILVYPYILLTLQRKESVNTTVTTGTLRTAPVRTPLLLLAISFLR